MIEQNQMAADAELDNGPVVTPIDESEPQSVSDGMEFAPPQLAITPPVIPEMIARNPEADAQAAYVNGVAADDAKTSAPMSLDFSEESKAKKVQYLNALESENSKERIAALNQIARDYTIPASARVEAMRKIAQEVQYGDEITQMMKAPRVRAQVALAEEGGDIDRTYHMIERDADPVGRVQQTAQMTLPMGDNIQVLKAMKGMKASDAANYAIDYANSKARFWSADTLSLVAFGPQEQLRGMAFLKALNDPYINNYLDSAFVQGAGYTAGWGTVKGGIADVIANLPEANQKRLVEEAVKYLSLNNVIGTDGNALIEADVIGSIFHTIANRKYLLENTGLDKQTSRFIGESFENIVSTLNYTGLGVLVKAPFRAANFGIRSVFGLFSKTAPRRVGKDLAEAALNPTVARVLGTTPEEILNSVTPAARQLLKEPNISVNAFSDIIQAEMRRSTLKRDLMESLRVSVSKVPVEAVADTYRKFLGRNGVVGQPQLSAVEVVGDSLNVTGRYGKAQEAGFDSVEEAMSHFRKVFPAATEKDVQVSIRHKPSNTIVGIGDETYDDALEVASRAENAKDFDFFIDVNHSTAISNLDTLEDFVDASFIGQKLSPVNRTLFRWTRGYERLWDNNTNNLINSLSSRHRFVSQTIENLAGPEIKAIKGTSDEAALNEVLFKNAGLDRVFNPQELTKMGLSSHKGQMAYYAYRSATDILHDVADMGLADSKRKEGFKRLFNSTGEQINLAREISPSTIWQRSQKASFLNPITDEVETLDAAMLASKMQDGDIVMELDRAMWRGTKEVPYAIIKKNDTVDALGNIGISGILPRASGYFPEMWRGNIAIRGVSESGRSYLLAIAENTADAKEWIRNNAKNYDVVDEITGETSSRFPKGISFEYDKGLRDPLMRTKGIHDVYENTKGLIYGEKSNATIYNASPTGDAIAVDPLAAMQVASQVLADNFTKGRLLQSMMKQFDSFARESGLVRPDLPEGTLVDGVDKLIDRSSIADPEMRRLWDNAQAWGQTIASVAITPDAVDTAISAGMKMLANFVASTSLGGWSAGKYMEAKLLKRAGENNDVGAWFQKWTHFTNIVTSPHRQFAMNVASSLTNLAHPRGYAAAMSNLATFEKLLFMEMSWAKGAFVSAKEFDGAYRSAAKSMGMPVDEVKQLVKAFRTSGLYEQTAHHWLAKNAVRTEAEIAATRMANGGYKKAPFTLGGMLAKGWNKSWNAKDAVFDRMSGVFNSLGFEMGEHMNTMSTFLTQYYVMRGQKGFNLAKSDSLKQLVGKTQTWIGNMTAEGRSSYQSGWLKNFFQYMAFQHKMLANIMPAKLGGVQALTWAEKWGIATTQLMLWGSQANAYGRALRMAVEEAIIEDDTIPADEVEKRLQIYRALGIDRLIELGLGGIGINDGLRQLSLAFKNDGVYKLDTMREDFAFNSMLSAGGDVEFMMGRFWAVKDILSGAGSREGLGVALLGVNGPKIFSWFDWVARATSLVGTIATDPEERAAAAEAFLKDTGKTFVSSYGAYLGLQAMKQFGYEIDKRGNITKAFEENFRSETAALFKIKPTEVESFYLEKERTSGWYTGSETEEEKAANDLFQKSVDKIMLLPDEALGQEYGTALLSELNKEMTGLYATLPYDVAVRIREKVDAKYVNAMSEKSSMSAKMKALLGKVAASDGTEEDIEKAKELLVSEWARTHPEIGAWLIPYLKQKEIIRETK